MKSRDSSAPAFVRLAAHPVRWQLLSAMAGRDYRVRELVELLGQPQNLVSYHLRLLREAGLVVARRSSFDGRDSYHHLDLERCADGLAATGLALHPALRLGLDPAPPAHAAPSPRPSVLFACTGNSARSPIAAALMRHRAGDGVDVASAGSHPKQRIHPHAVRVLRDDYGIDIADQEPAALDATAHRRFDQVVSLCDRVREVRPELRNERRLIHWSIPDPAAEGDGRAGYPAFRRAAADIDSRVRFLLPALDRSTNPEVHP